MIICKKYLDPFSFECSGALPDPTHNLQWRPYAFLRLSSYWPNQPIPTGQPINQAIRHALTLPPPFFCLLGDSNENKPVVGAEDEEVAKMGCPSLGEHTTVEVLIEESYEFKVRSPPGGVDLHHHVAPYVAILIPCPNLVIVVLCTCVSLVSCCVYFLCLYFCPPCA